MASRTIKTLALTSAIAMGAVIASTAAEAHSKRWCPRDHYGWHMGWHKGWHHHHHMYSRAWRPTYAYSRPAYYGSAAPAYYGSGYACPGGYYGYGGGGLFGGSGLLGAGLFGIL